MRAVLIVAAAIRLLQPGLPKEQRLSYATVLVDEERRHKLPALLGVAIAHNESKLHRGIVSDRGSERYVGLGQIRLRNYGACRESFATPACQAVQAELLSGEGNLRAMGRAFAANRRLCTRHGSPGIAAALAGYQGNATWARVANKRVLVCRPTRLTLKVLAHWRQLEQSTRRRR